jgi:hypothetical protein
VAGIRDCEQDTFSSPVDLAEIGSENLLRLPFRPIEAAENAIFRYHADSESVRVLIAAILKVVWTETISAAAQIAGQSPRVGHSSLRNRTAQDP